MSENDLNQNRVLEQVGEEIRRARQAGNIEQAAEFVRVGRQLIGPDPDAPGRGWSGGRNTHVGGD